MDVRYDFEPVEVTALAGQSSRQLYLITAWSKTSNRPMHLLTNREVKSLAQALLIIIGYLSRWSVEETYRFYKIGQGLETMRLMTLGGLKNMLHASFYRRLDFGEDEQSYFLEASRSASGSPHQKGTR